MVMMVISTLRGDQQCLLQTITITSAEVLHMFMWSMQSQEKQQISVTAFLDTARKIT